MHRPPNWSWLLVIAIAACSQRPFEPQAAPAPAPRALSRSFSNEPLRPIPDEPAQNPAVVALGKKLFSDARLSGSGAMSCSTCHNLAASGTDQVRHSLDDTLFDTPTVFNASLNPRLFWDGRARSLEDQIDGPLQNKHEMANTWPNALAFLNGDPDYRAAFKAAMGEPATKANVKHALATFERTLLTPESPFDRYLTGNSAGMSSDALKGYALFKDYGCSSCHQGSNVGGSMFEKLGVATDYFEGRRGSARDDGRENLTNNPEDKHVFRVPSLRLAMRTAPYLHDGSVATIDETISLMGTYQLDVDIPDHERQQIAAFLESLVGTYDGRPL